MEHDLVDEYRLMVFPVVLGKGPDGVLVLTYQRATDS